MNIGSDSTLNTAKNTKPMCDMGAMSHLLTQTSSDGQKFKQLTSADYRRLIVDLQTRLNERDNLVKSIQARQEKLSRSCRVQRKLIDYLREQNTSQAQQIVELQCTPAHASTQAVSEQQIRTRGRVQSLDGALSRILGVEIPEPKSPVATDEIALYQLDEIDMEEFQPVVEYDTSSNLLSRLNGILASVVDLAVHACKVVQKFVSSLIVWMLALPWRELKHRVVVISASAQSRSKTLAAALVHHVSDTMTTVVGKIKSGDTV